MTHRITRSVPSPRTSTRTARVALETLEQRDLMAVDVFYNAGYNQVPGSVVLEADVGKNTVILRVDTRGTSNPHDDRLTISRKTNNSATVSTWVPLWQKHSVNNQYYPALHLIVFRGGTGDDYFENQSAVGCIARGEGGTDFLLGGSGHDSLRGGSGTDTLSGGKGDDDLDGGTGVDFLFGGDDHDSLYGGNDSVQDLLNGGSGKDEFISSWLLIDKLDDYNGGAGDHVTFI